jgi:CubicO group peptidase (beta-lactamase class C family)
MLGVLKGTIALLLATYARPTLTWAQSSNGQSSEPASSGKNASPPVTPPMATPPMAMPPMYTPQQLREDFRIVRQALEEGHPGVYRYVSKERLERKFNAAEKQLDQPMDLYSFYRVLAPMVASIECGHTNINLPASELDRLKQNALLLPLSVKCIRSKIYVFRDYTRESSDLPGSEIRAINGQPIDRIVRTLLAAAQGDGEILTGRFRQVGGFFNRGLYVLCGLHAPYRVLYREAATGQQKEAELAGLTWNQLAATAQTRYPEDNQRPDHAADLQWFDEGKIAVMTIHGFYGYADKEQKKPLGEFIPEAFAQFQRKGTRSLILDLRNNGGGDDDLGKLLFSYLTDRPFQYYNDLVINALHFDFMRYAQQPDDIPEHVKDVQKMPDGRYRLISHPNWGLQQPQQPGFAGKVFILMNGGSFSTTCEFISIMHFHHRAVFIGEEAGGGYYGNTSGFMPILALPNTKLTLRVPLMKYVLAVSGYRFPKRGVMPDYPIQPTIADMLAGRDPQMAFALTLASKTAQTNASPRKVATVKRTFQEKLPVWMAQYHIPAVGVALIENGKLAETHVFGDLRKDIPAPDNALFEVASLTKPVVAMLTLTLVAAGKWDLDEPLYHYWIDPDISGDSRYRQLTTRLVLSHQTGFPNWRLESPSHRLSFEFNPGAGYRYSGEGFEYLRHALEHKFNKPLDQIANSYLLKPLGLHETRFYWDDRVEASRFAMPHDKDGVPSEQQQLFYQNTKDVSAADRVMTTVADYGKFGVAVIKGSGLSSAVYREMVKPQVALPETEGHSVAFGLGWELVSGLSNGDYALIHDGHDYGICTLALLLPKTKRGLVILTNGDKGDAIFKTIITESLDIGNELVARLNM